MERELKSMPRARIWMKLRRQLVDSSMRVREEVRKHHRRIYIYRERETHRDVLGLGRTSSNDVRREGRGVPIFFLVSDARVEALPLYITPPSRIYSCTYLNPIFIVRSIENQRSRPTQQDDSSLVLRACRNRFRLPLVSLLLHAPTHGPVWSAPKPLSVLVPRSPLVTQQSACSWGQIKHRTQQSAAA